jgi:ATP-binding cassette subfamily F protein 3
MLLRPLNFILLDEPTHHLDIQSKDVLKQALKDYDGTFLIVSHDRDFLHGLTDRLFEVKDGRLRDHHMDILELIERNKALVQEMNATPKVAAKPAPAKAAPAGDDREARKEREKEARRLRTVVERAEAEMAKLEGEQKQLEASIATGSLDTDALQNGYARLGVIAERTAELMRDWEEAGAKLDQLVKQEA